MRKIADREWKDVALSSRPKAYPSEPILESLADESTKQKLAKARAQARAKLARKLRVSMGTVRHSEKRIDLYLSIARENLERRGGSLWLQVEFPNELPVRLTGLGGENRKTPKKKAAATAKSKPKSRRSA
ncbi:MAG TPA: hypothetical protein VG225_17715 [Terracidiphilus sp.]|jgi:hypothetical protein|nr:hypothetical protein [Terracidiphilus sp.]